MMIHDVIFTDLPVFGEYDGFDNLLGQVILLTKAVDRLFLDIEEEDQWQGDSKANMIALHDELFDPVNLDALLGRDLDKVVLNHHRGCKIEARLSECSCPREVFQTCSLNVDATSSEEAKWVSFDQNLAFEVKLATLIVVLGHVLHDLFVFNLEIDKWL